MKLLVLIRRESAGGFSVRVPTFPGCYSEGETLEAALANIREAAELWLEVTADSATRESLADQPSTIVREIEL